MRPYQIDFYSPQVTKPTIPRFLSKMNQQLKARGIFRWWDLLNHGLPYNWIFLVLPKQAQKLDVTVILRVSKLLKSCFDAAEKWWNFGLFGRDPSSFGIIKKREDRRVSNWIVARSQAAEQPSSTRYSLARQLYFTTAFYTHFMHIIPLLLACTGWLCYGCGTDDFINQWVY